MNRYENKAWRESMRIRVDYNNMMADFVGEKGIRKAQLEASESAALTALAALEERRDQMKWRDLPYSQGAVVRDIKAAAAHVRENFDAFVVLGIGGSALGPIAVQQALSHLRYNELNKEKRNGPKLYVEDNIDPERMASLFDVIDLERTAFNVITKSGSTSETMAQLLLVVNLLKKRLGDKWTEHVIATTDEKKGNLIKIAQANNLRTFYVPDGVGGRFSELCPVGLLAAAVCGADIDELLAGAAYADEICKDTNVWANPAAVAALLEKLAMDAGNNISVMMPYADSLRYVADWYAQLWAESLGKATDRSGARVNCGQTPVKALGVTDQHSQVQLYTEGPFDKVVTFLRVGEFRQNVVIPRAFDELPDVAFLSGHSFNELIQSEQRATEYAVLKSGHLNKTITVPEVNAFTVGQLLYIFEVQTALAGELLNIDAFDQPGVEEGKNATYALLGKPGYEQKKAELDLVPRKNTRYTV
ncbi:MAG: glucose-6-phosphate isomerase [Clostridiaceae bacterium]|nr:glucose-6-phosphate isomerase [Eubacteriales bacterium]